MAEQDEMMLSEEATSRLRPFRFTLPGGDPIYGYGFSELDAADRLVAAGHVVSVTVLSEPGEVG